MNKETLAKLAAEEALAMMISSNEEELSADEITAVWADDREPEGVGVWEPFEYYSPARLLDIFEGIEAQFLRFSIDLLGEEGK